MRFITFAGNRSVIQNVSASSQLTHNPSKLLTEYYLLPPMCNEV